MSVALAAPSAASVDRLRADDAPLALQAALVVGTALLTGLLAQFELRLYLWEVPLTLQSLAVYGSGLFLGWRLGALSMALYLALEHLARSPWGRVLRAIREDEAAALALGKGAARFRLQAFALGGAIMGLAGATQAHFIGYIAPDNYQPILTFQVWAMLIVGGSGNNRGAILGAIVVWGIWALSASVVAGFFPAEQQARAASLQIVMIGLALCAILLWRPRGILGEARIMSRHVLRRTPAAAPLPPTSSET